MTFFLNEAPPQTVKARGPDMQPTALMEGIGASFSKAQLENDSNFRVSREKSREATAVSTQAAERIGVDAIYQEGLKKGLFAKAANGDMAPPTTISELFAQDYRAQIIARDMALADAEANPEAWKDIDLSDEGVDARVNEKLQAEHQDHEEIIAMMPSGQGVSALVGGISGITSDVKNLPFLVLGGGGGSVLRILGREAAINVAAETAFLPAQFAMAERLDIPDPNIPQQLAFAGIGGAAFAGVPLAISRGLHYARGRNAVKLPNLDADRSEILTTAAENALHNGEDPFEAIRRAAEDIPEPEPQRPPLITTERLPPLDGEAPSIIPAEDLAAQADTAIAEAEAQLVKDFPEMRHKYPLGRVIQQLGGVKAKMRNANGDMVATPLAEELAAMGVTQRTHPFMFRKDGHTDLDNIPASEHGGLSDTVKVDAQTGYFDRQSLISALGRELSTGDKHPLSGDILARTDELRLARDGGPKDAGSFESAFIAGERVEGGFFVDLQNAEFTGGRFIEENFDAWAADRGFNDLLTPDERTEILTQLEKTGGDAEILVSRALEREQDFVESPDAKTGSAETQGGIFPDEAFPISAKEGGGGARTDGSGPAFEPTAAGDQSLIPGVDPITGRQRLEAQQSRPIDGGQRGPDSQIGGLFDPNDKVRLDMFSDPASSEARVVQDALASDIQDQIKADGDFTVDVGDGRGPRPASEMLADLDQGDIFAARIDLCGKGPA